MPPNEQALGNSGKEKLPFNRKTLLAELSRLRKGQPSAATGWVWGEGRRGSEPEINYNYSPIRGQLEN